MMFNSWEFVCFIIPVLMLYYILSLRAQNIMLLLASYFFYGCWDWRFLILLWISTVVDYSVGRAMQKNAGALPIRRVLLLASLITNLGILGFFKYYNFFVESGTTMLESIGIPVSPATLQIILPVGISFYTFQTLAYTIDVYRRKIEPVRDVLHFALYMAFFPQLVAGPIERAQHLLPALARKRTVTDRHIGSGLLLIIVGYVKKLAVADFLAGSVNAFFSSPGQYHSLQLVVGVYAFALLIYGDFSGYTDIARGTSRLLGIELMVNFRRPYFASNITDFWRRWHISLSTWLRDYLYIPLGGSHCSRWKMYRNLMITMLLGGLWHGESWNFVIWGALHGVFLVAHKMYTAGSDKTEPAVSPHTFHALVRSVAGGVITFHLVCFAWIFFRASSGYDSLIYLQSIAGNGLVVDTQLLKELHQLLIVVVILLVIDLPKAAMERRGREWRHIGWFWQGAFAGVMICCLLLLGDRINAPFIYFQF